MNTQSNLAFALEDMTDDFTESQTLNAVELDALLRLGSQRARRPVRAGAARARRLPVSFQDNHSGPFRPFRVY